MCTTRTLHATIDVLAIERKKALTCCIERQQDSIKGNWKSSDANGNTKECHRLFNWIRGRTTVIFPNT